MAQQQRMLVDAATGERVTAAEWVRRMRNREHANANAQRTDPQTQGIGHKPTTPDELRQQFQRDKTAQQMTDRALAAEIETPAGPLNAAQRVLELVSPDYLDRHPKARRTLKREAKRRDSEISREAKEAAETAARDADPRLQIARSASAQLLEAAEKTGDPQTIEQAKQLDALARDGRSLKLIGEKHREVADALAVHYELQRKQLAEERMTLSHKLIEADEQCERLRAELREDPPQESDANHDS